MWVGTCVPYNNRFLVIDDNDHDGTIYMMYCVQYHRTHTHNDSQQGGCITSQLFFYVYLY